MGNSTKMDADSLAQITPNASKNFSPKCLPKPKSLRFLKKSSLWVSVVRAVYNGMQPTFGFLTFEYALKN